ncbi:MAG: tetratricopeptide repeat protein [Phycisphaerae bacterium]
MSQSPATATQANVDNYVAGWTALYEMLRGTGSLSGRERNCAYLNLGNGRFADVSAISGVDFADDGRAVAVTDWDQDGAPDFWIRNRTAPRLRFMHNRLDPKRHHLSLRLEGRYCNRDAIGARVEVQLGDAPGSRRVKGLRAGDGYLAQSSKWLHFGLGDHTQARNVVVRWPGGMTESFGQLQADRRYRLVQGSGKVQEVPPRRPIELLKPSKLASPPVQEQARIVLAARVPMPQVNYQSFQGQPVPLRAQDNAPLLINVWASWCEPCLAELTDLTNHRKDLQRAGLSVLTLNVDEPANRPRAQALLAKWGQPFQAGVASPELLDVLDVLQRSLLDRHRRLPLPTSFLVDAQNRLAIIYKGPINAADLLKDLAGMVASPDQIRSAAAQFPGRWFLPPRLPDLVDLADKFRRQGLPRIAQQYLASATGSSTPTGTPPSADPRVATLEYNMGVALSREGKYAQAEAAYRRALQINPDYVRAHINLGIALKKQGDIQGAVQQYETALRLDPEHPLAHHNLGAALIALGRTQEGNAHLARAQQLQAAQTGRQ